MLSGLSLYAANSRLNWEGQYNYSPARLAVAAEAGAYPADTIWYYKDFIFSAVGKYLSGLTLTLSTLCPELAWPAAVRCSGRRRTLAVRRPLLLGGYLLAGLIYRWVSFREYQQHQGAGGRGAGAVFYTIVARGTVGRGKHHLKAGSLYGSRRAAPDLTVAELLKATM